MWKWQLCAWQEVSLMPVGRGRCRREPGRSGWERCSLDQPSVRGTPHARLSSSEQTCVMPQAPDSLWPVLIPVLKQALIVSEAASN